MDARTDTLDFHYDTKDETSYYEREFDVATGLETVTRKVAKNKIVVIDKYTRDSTGDLLRLDMYDPDTNKPYGYREFANGLRKKDSYHFLDGTSKQVDYFYDASRTMTSAKLTQNGQFICTFSFDRLPDGTIKRSLAKGPDGQLWAEYPNAMVTNVNRDGSAVDGSPGTIYKTGDWWSDSSGKS